MSCGSGESGRTIFVAVAVDDSYIIPLLVMLRSACRHLSIGWRLEVFVLGFRISGESRHRLELGLGGLPVSLHWQTLDLSAVEKYWPGIQEESDITCYYRLFLGSALPEWMERVLFLDADLLVEGDLSALWNLSFDGCIVQAVPDAYARTFHTRRLSAIRFSEGVSFAAGTPYFNAGVQLIDLLRWREERIGESAGAFLWKYGRELTGRDQDALNCALAGRWKALPSTWNLQELPDRPDTWEDGGASTGEVREAVRRPAIIHFVGWKPWSRRWRPLRHQRWWDEARRAGVPPVRRPWGVVIWEALVWRPRMRLKWHLHRRQWR